MSRKRDPKRDAQALALRQRGCSYPTIARRMGVGLATAHRMVQRAGGQEPTESPELARDLELLRLDHLQRQVIAILHTDAPTVSSGRLVKHNGEPVPDLKVKLQAVDRLLAISDRRCRILGLHAPQVSERTIRRADISEAAIERAMDDEVNRLTAELDAFESLADLPPADHGSSHDRDHRRP